MHDLSHPVQNIGNSCKLIVRVFDDPEMPTFTRTIDREIDTLKRVLDDLRNVARPAPVGASRSTSTARSPTSSIVRVLRKSPALDSKRSSRRNRSLSRATCSRSARVASLITNAIQATESGGLVTVSTARNRDRVEVMVTDTGSGIPAERLAAIFDDFVTTKKRGLGLGLAITKRIVEQLNGTIGVTSEVGKGTTFTMRFPVALRQVAVAALDSK